MKTFSLPHAILDLMDILALSSPEAIDLFTDAVMIRGRDPNDTEALAAWGPGAAAFLASAHRQ